MSHLGQDWSSWWSNDQKSLKEVSWGCFLSLFEFSFQGHSQNHGQVGGSKFLQSSSATGNGWGTEFPEDFFFFQINAHFLPHFAIGPLSDTKFYPFTFSCLYFITFYRCFQTQITPALCHWYTPAIELKLAGGGKWHFFPLNGWETPSLPHPISYQVCHFFLPNVSRICFSLSTPTITTLVQDSTTSYCCNSRLLLLLPLASSSSPTQSTTIRTLFLLFYHSLAQKSLGAPHCPRNKVQPKLRLQTLCAGPSEQGRHDYSFMAFTD